MAKITLNRPNKLNSMTDDMAKQLTKVMKEINHDHEIRAVILTGSGERSFSTGSDIKQLDQYPTPWDFRNREDEYARSIM